MKQPNEALGGPNPGLGGPDPGLGGLDRVAGWLSLFDHLSDGVCVSDASFKVLYLNPAARRILRLDGRPRGGLNVCDLISHALATPQLGRCSGVCPLQERPLETAVTVQLEGVRIRCLAAPETIGGAGLHLTILEDNRAEVELKRHQEDWRSMIAHDLRTPLTPILATLLMLQENAALGEQDRKLVDLSIAASRRMLDLLNLYLDVAKLDAGLMAVLPAKVPLSELARRAAEEQGALARQKDQALALDVPESLAVIADAELLFRVAQNLVNNAIKYTQVGGRIQVGAERAGAGVRLWVRDNGPGIAVKEMAKLFDRFYQAQARRAGMTLGTGLGLAFCKQALEAMGGRIFVTSERNVGTEFSIVLPEWKDEVTCSPRTS